MQPRRYASMSTPRRPLGKTWQIIPLDEPWHIMRGPDVHDRPDRRIVIKRRDTKHDMWLIGAIGNDMRAAQRAESPHPAR